MNESLEELRIRVGDVERNYAEVARLVAMREENSKNVAERVDAIYNLLLGTSDSNPGLKIKVDRLEMAQATNREHRAILYAGVVGLAINAGWEWLKSRLHG